jgi:3-hydroxyethyl bacteriochlorophyllide a dehydrogenase
MGYPLVPGYETVGRIVDGSGRAGEMVFVPGANCFGDVRGLFGGAASRLVVPSDRALRIDPNLGEQGVLLALAATALHVLTPPGGAPLSEPPDLIVGHGVLGRLLARLVVQSGAPPPMVWESNAERTAGAVGYEVVSPDTDGRDSYRRICDVSGDAGLLDRLINRLSRGGEIVLAGFYPERLSFAFPPAFMREARFRVAAEFRPDDLEAVRRLIEDARLSLDGLITHRSDAAHAADAYRTAFHDPACLKMILDWSDVT